jgi:hypothetical protein
MDGGASTPQKATMIVILQHGKPSERVQRGDKHEWPAMSEESATEAFNLLAVTYRMSDANVGFGEGAATN